MKPLPAEGAKIAVLHIVSQRSKGGRGVIAAATLREIENDLRKIHDVELTRRQILNHIHDWGDLIIRDTDPVNKRRTLYRMNRERVDEQIFTTIKLNDERVFAHDGYQGILMDPPPQEWFFAIDRVDHKCKARTSKEFKMEVRVNYRFTQPNSIFLSIQPEGSERWLTSKTRVLTGDGVETLILKVLAPKNPGEWKLFMRAYILEESRWIEADKLPLRVQLDEKYPREITVSGRKVVGLGNYFEETGYGLTIEVDSEEEVKEAVAYGRALINSWLAEPPNHQF